MLNYLLHTIRVIANKHLFSFAFLSVSIFFMFNIMNFFYRLFFLGLSIGKFNLFGLSHFGMET